MSVDAKEDKMRTLWALAFLLGLGGFVSSFTTVSKEMAPAFGNLAWLVPTTIDIGIIVFTLLDIKLAKLDKKIGWLRYVPWALTAGTIYLNMSAYKPLEFKIAHAVLPSMWVVFCEVIAHIKRRETQEINRTRTDPVPKWRWICAPWATLKLWRSMKLWNILSYQVALAAEEERQLSKAAIVSNFGSLRKAPGLLRVRYRQQKITVAEVYRVAAATPRAVRTKTGWWKKRANTPVKTAPVIEQQQGKPNTSQTAATEQQPTVANAKPVTEQQLLTVDSGANTTEHPEPNTPRSVTEKLSDAYAQFVSAGSTPSIRALAKEVGCSTSTASAFKNNLDK